MIDIRAMQEADIPAVVSFLADTTEAFMHQWGGGRWYAYPVTTGQMAVQFRTRNTDTLYYLIRNDDEIIGSFEFDFIDRIEKQCSLCRYLIRRESRSQGFGTETLKVITRHAFEELGMRRITLTVFDFNIGAHRCYTKAGFVETERVTRENGWVAIRMELRHAPA